MYIIVNMYFVNETIISCKMWTFNIV